jgi:membrane protein required for colicin V production
MTPFDIVVLIVVGLSALYALSRGLVTELLSLLAWFGALIAVRFLFTPVSAWLRGWFESAALADVAALVGTFAAAFGLFRWLATFAGGKVKDSSLGPLDRLGGAAFGMARGLLVVSLAYLALGLVVDRENFPVWITQAKTQPVVEQTANMLGVVTAAVRHGTAEEMLDTGRFFNHPELGEIPVPPSEDEGYSDEERRALEDLLRKEEESGNARSI